MNILKLVFLLFLLTFVNASAQNQSSIPAPTKIIPPSPTAAALGKYGDIPISNYTGTIGVNIPLYTVKVGSLELPISLSYHASGIRVEEEASWCGLGWSLMAGGVITRSIRGVDDLRDDGNGIGYPEYPFPVTADANNNYTPPNSSPWSDLQFFSDSHSNTKDPEPDVFYFNFSGHSGKFYMQQKPSISSPYTFLIESQEKMKIELLYGSQGAGRYWIITTEDGVKYYFGTEEKVKPYKGSSAGLELSPDALLASEDTYLSTSSWYLDSIISPVGEIINFTYTAPSTGSKSLVSRSESRTYILKTEILAQTSGCMPQSTPPQHNYHRSRNVAFDVYLKEISFYNGKINFSTSNRNDIEPYNVDGSIPQKLEKIQVLSGDINQGLKEIKHYQFNYNYFVNYDPYLNYSRGTQNYTYSKTYTSKRLKLLSLSENFENGAYPPFEFEYVTNSYPYGDIPDKYSKAQDNWGFFNNETGNILIQDPLALTGYVSTMMPSFINMENNTLYNGAVRNVNEDFMKLGILRRIKYPTGGTSEFEYESNDYSNFPTEYENQSRTAQLLSFGSFVNAEDEGLDSSQPSSIFIDVAEATELNINAYGDYTWSFCYNSPTSYGGTGSFVVQSTGSTPFFRRARTLPIDCNYAGVHSEKILVPPGTYEIKVTGEDYVIMMLYMSWKERVTTPLLIKKGGGLRISRTIDYNGFDHSLDVVKKYIYTDTTNTNGIKSSGLLMSPLNYEYLSTFHFSQDCSGIGFGGVVFNTTYLNRSSESNVLLGNSAKGNSIGYSTVTVLNGNNGENGKTIYNYLNEPDILSTPFYPSIPNKPHQGNGLLASQIVYKATHDPTLPFQKVNELRKEYTNELSVKKTTKGMKCFGCESVAPAMANGVAYIPTIKFYDNSSEWWHPKNETSIVYDPEDESKYSSTKTDYFYENAEHLQLTKTISQESDGSSTITEYKYPADYVGINTGPLSIMKGNLHIHNAVIEKTVKKRRGENVSIVDASYTDYRDADGGVHGTPLFPSRFYNFNLAAPKSSFVSSLNSGEPADPSYVLKETKRYDSYGNIKEVTFDGKLPSSYIWGYKGMYPVAEVRNAAVKDIFYTGFEDSVVEGNSSDCKAGRHSKLNGYQKVLAELSVGNYTLEYWRKNDEIWVPVIVKDISVTNGEYAINIAGHIDEVRFYPAQALISTYTYDPLVGMTSACDPKGQFTYYSYDSFNRLKFLKDQSKNVIKENAYHYKP